MSSLTQDFSFKQSMTKKEDIMSAVPLAKITETSDNKNNDNNIESTTVIENREYDETNNNDNDEKKI